MAGNALNRVMDRRKKMVRNWRWTFLSNQVGDSRISDYVLSDAVDLAWLELARDLEPQVDALLKKRRPDRRYTARDFQHAYRCQKHRTPKPQPKNASGPQSR